MRPNHRKNWPSQYNALDCCWSSLLHAHICRHEWDSEEIARNSMDSSGCYVHIPLYVWMGLGCMSLVSLSNVPKYDLKLTILKVVWTGGMLNPMHKFTMVRSNLSRLHHLNTVILERPQGCLESGSSRSSQSLRVALGLIPLDGRSGYGHLCLTLLA